MAQSGSNKKVANSLVAVSSAAVLAVYAAGFARTRSAAIRLDAQSAERRTTPKPIATPAPASPATHALAKPEPVKSAAPVSIAASVPHAATEPSPAETPVPSSPSEPVVVPETAPLRPAPEPKVEVLAAPSTPPAPPVPAAPVWKDGTYLGWGTSRHGDIQASVVIEGGRIASATIAQCWTRYSCDVIDKLPPQVAQRQSPEVDFVSGATQSANAFYYGVVDALSKAK